MKDYYNDPGVRQLCHEVKRNSRYAAEEMAEYFIESGRLNPSSVIIPAPQHNGHAGYTKSIAEIIKRHTGAEVADILKCVPHEPLYYQKQRGFLFAPVFFLSGKVPKHKDIFFLDNVYDTGTTYKTACSLFNRDLNPLIYAKVNKRRCI